MEIDYSKFIEDGFLHIPQILDATLLTSAQADCRANNGWGAWSDREYDRNRGWRDRRGSPPGVMALLTSEIREVISKGFCSDVIWGDGEAQHAQVISGSPSIAEFNPHVDGVSDLKAPINVYGLQLGILLTDIPSEYMGNFTVWPGSHKKVQAALFGTYEHQLARAIWDCSQLAEQKPGHQICGRAGDVIINHHLLLHGTAPNRRGQQRDLIFFRLHPGDPNQLHQRERERRTWDSLDRYCSGWK